MIDDERKQILLQAIWNTTNWDIVECRDAGCYRIQRWVRNTETNEIIRFEYHIDYWLGTVEVIREFGIGGPKQTFSAKGYVFLRHRTRRERSHGKSGIRRDKAFRTTGNESWPTDYTESRPTISAQDSL